MKDPSLTPLGVMVLAILREGDMHPYEMIRLLRHRRDDRRAKITNGTFYHAVARLERHGYIAEVGVERDGNRPERTTYTLTETGPAALEDWVRAHLDGDSGQNFRVALAEAHNLPRDEVIALVSARRDELAAELASAESMLASAAARGVADQFVIELARRLALLRADVDWTDSFLARLRREDYSWGTEGLTPKNLAAHETMRKAAQK